MANKLTFQKETLHTLTPADLDDVYGGKTLSSVLPPGGGPQTGYRPPTTKVSSVKPPVHGGNHGGGHHKIMPTSSAMRPRPVAQR